MIYVLSDFIDLEERSFARLAALQAMGTRNGRYDEEVFAAVSDWCNFHPDKPAKENESAAVPLQIGRLREGYVLGEDLQAMDGMLILANNTKLTEIPVTRLQN